MSNQVDAFKAARDNYNSAKKAGTTGRDLAQLKATMDAAAAACPGGKPKTGFLD